MDLKNIRLVGCDLDGTLLHDDKTISAQTKQAIKQLYNAGVRFVPITGRPFNGVPDCILQMPEIEYVVTSNGAQIVDMKTKNSIYSFQIPNKTCNDLIAILQNTKCQFEAFCDNVGYIEQSLYDYYVATFKGTVLWDYIQSSKQVTPSVAQIFNGTNKGADEFFVVCESEQIRQELVENLSDFSNVQHSPLGDNVLEITNLGTDKGNALSVLCKHFNVDESATLVFGDGENDLLLLEKAGVAVAMQNAFECVKQRADVITKSNNDDGVLQILQKIIN